jgi:hypothetical protein
MIVFLDVSFEDKEIVKKQGAKWDTKKKSWYIGKGKLTSILKNYINEDEEDGIEDED